MVGFQRSLEDVDDLNSFQSGFRPDYSAKTVLIVLIDDLLETQYGKVHPSWPSLISEWYLVTDHGVLLCWFRVLEWKSS